MKLITMPRTLTPREVFDKVKTHLLAQSRRSQDADGRSLYHGLAGQKCAAGSLIGDEFYDPSFEGMKVWESPVHHALRASGVPESAMDLVYDLQSVHDNVPVERWPSELAAIEASRIGVPL